MSLLRTVQFSVGSSQPLGQNPDVRPFFEAFDPLRLHDAEAGFSRTDAAPLGEVGFAHVVSTGHEIGVVEEECVTLLAPRTGRIHSVTGAGALQSVERGALLFWPNRRETRVERGHAPEFRAVALRIPTATVLTVAGRLDRALARQLGGGDLQMSLDPSRMSGVHLLTDFCLSLLDEFEREDSLLAHSSARSRASTQIIETLVEILKASGALPKLPERTDGVALRYVQAAEDYMRDAFEDIVSIGEVSRAIGVSDRVLQLSFGVVRGETPRQTLATIRLDAARARLLAPAADVSVTSAALTCGFSHLGRFAIAYRARFGESPSETLQRARSG